MNNSYQKLLLVYSILATLLLAYVAITIVNYRVNGLHLNKLIAHKIRIEEPDGTLRMVLSNHDRFPGIIVKGKEEQFDRPQAGMLFFNDEGSENGGLIFSGYKDVDGEVKNSGGSLTFDRYGGNQELQLIGVNDSDYAFTGLIVRDSPPNEKGFRRLWLGKDRILLEVKKNGEASIVFLDKEGKVQKRILPENN